MVWIGARVIGPWPGSIAKISECELAAAGDRRLEALDADAAPDRRNAGFRRHLLTAFGDMELGVPRTRRYSPVEILPAYARRTPEIDRAILQAFSGAGYRPARWARPYWPFSAARSAPRRRAGSPVRLMARSPPRPLQNRYTALLLDDVALARKTGAGALRRLVLVALGPRPDGKKEIVDRRLATSENAVEWDRCLADLDKRGLTGESLDMIRVDGGKGLTALPTVLPAIPVQRCWAHKIRNILD